MWETPTDPADIKRLLSLVPDYHRMALLVEGLRAENTAYRTENERLRRELVKHQLGPWEKEG